MRYLIRSLPWVLLAAGVIYLVYQVIISDAGIDLGVYRMGGDAVLHGLPVYEQTYHIAGLPFTYPPFSAIMFVPFALLSQTIALYVWTAVTVVLLAIVARLLATEIPALAGRAFPWSTFELTVLFLGLGLVLEPVEATFGFGQVNIMLMLFVLFDGLRRWKFSGVLTGIAAGIKLVPGVFMLFYLVARDWKRFIWSCAGLLFTILLGYLVMPSQANEYWFHLMLDQNRVGGVIYDGNQSVNAMVLRYLGPGSGGSAIPTIAMVIVLVVGMAVAVRLWSRSRLIALVTVGLTGLLVSPISWTHHWVWLLPLGTALIALALRFQTQVQSGFAWAAGILGGLTLFIGIAKPVWWPTAGGDVEYYHSFFQQIAGNSYVFLGLAILIFFAVLAVKREELFPGALAGDSEETVGPVAVPASA